MKIPFLDLKSQNLRFEKEILDTTMKIVQSGEYILGHVVDQFESDLANYLNVSNVVSCNSGYDALCLSLKALDLKAGDEVIVPAHTFIATWLAVSNLGLKLVPVDVELDTANIDCNRIEEKLTQKTKAIIAVHLYGRPAKLNDLLAICKRNQIYLIEDAAQAIGASYKGVKIGGHGDLICWSFYPGKNLGGIGDGGAVSSKNPELLQKLRILRNYGSDRKYYHHEMGINSRLNPINAAILKTKLSILDEDQKWRSKLAQLYIDNIHNARIRLPREDDSEFKCSWHLFVIRIINRMDFQLFLQEKGIQTLIHYPIACHNQEAFINKFKNTSDLKVSEKWSRECISLPISPFLSLEQIEYIIYHINKY